MNEREAAGGRTSWRFYEELNDFLAPQRRKVMFDYRFSRRVAIKDMIESLGVPHTEVDLILVNGQPVDFSYIVHDGDRISVYPVFESLDISSASRLRPQSLRVTRFVVDANLGRLASYLRMLGLDTLYRSDYGDAEIARISARGPRILLTRDRQLLKRACVTRAYYVRETAPLRQMSEVLQRFDLGRSIAPFTRCMRCNALLAPVTKEAVADILMPRTRKYYRRFWRCGGCGKIYWEGTHYQRMRRLLAGMLPTHGRHAPTTAGEG